MLLIISVFITDKRKTPNTSRFNLNKPNRVDVFKYTLASYASIDMWDECLFYIQLDDNYQDRREELETFIFQEFGESKCQVNWHRLAYVQEWKEHIGPPLQRQNNNPVWMATDDDHVFIDYNLDIIKDAVSYINNLTQYDHRAFFYSHWPEGMCNAAEESEDLNNFRLRRAKWPDSIKIYNAESLYFKMCEMCKHSHPYLPRLNDLGIGSPDGTPYPSTAYIIPKREICRHFDGYANVDAGGLHNVTPPLEIPPGFFEKNIKINYLFKERKEEWVNINPLVNNYYASDPNGTDYKWVLEDLPWCWRNRISTIEIAQTISECDIKEARNKAFMDHLTTDKVNYRHALRSPPVDWFAKFLR